VRYAEGPQYTEPMGQGGTGVSDVRTAEKALPGVDTAIMGLDAALNSLENQVHRAERTLVGVLQPERGPSATAPPDTIAPKTGFPTSPIADSVQNHVERLMTFVEKLSGILDRVDVAS
jgi:hypothetical protein